MDSPRTYVIPHCGQNAEVLSAHGLDAASLADSISRAADWKTVLLTPRVQTKTEGIARVLACSFRTLSVPSADRSSRL